MPRRRSRIAVARWRQSLKSPAMMIGRSRDASSSSLPEIASSCRFAPALVQRVTHTQCRLRRQPGTATTLQQAAALVAVVGHVLVAEGDEAEARQDRVAVVAMVVDRVLTVDVLPLVAGDERVLRVDRAAGEAHGEALVQPLHFLQEHHVGLERAQAVAQLVDHQAAVELRQPLVDVEGDDAQLVAHGSSSKRRSSKSPASKGWRPMLCRPHWRAARRRCGPSAEGARMAARQARHRAQLVVRPQRVAHQAFGIA